MNIAMGNKNKQKVTDMQYYTERIMVGLGRVQEYINRITMFKWDVFDCFIHTRTTLIRSHS